MPFANGSNEMAVLNVDNQYTGIGMTGWDSAGQVQPVSGNIYKTDLVLLDIMSIAEQIMSGLRIEISDVDTFGGKTLTT